MEEGKKDDRDRSISYLPELVADDLNVHLVQILLAHAALKVGCQWRINKYCRVQIRDVIANAQGADGFKPGEGETQNVR